MAISEKTRKNLWAKSGNRCSICKAELFSTNSIDASEFNIGEECHIISSKSTGPRHKSDVANYDTFENLILLCRNHHKEIDELYDTYTEEVLRYFKTNHENWIKATINKALNSGKTDTPKFLAQITSGKELLNIISETYGYMTDYDEAHNQEEAEYIGSIFQNLIDYGDVSGFIEPFQKVTIGYELQELLQELDVKGYSLFGERARRKITFGKNDSDVWPVATLILKRKDSLEILKMEI